jgi:DNA-binding HxlR family transcriptional regulator
MAMTPHEGTICGHFQRAAELVGQRWVPQVIYVLQAGPARYSAVHAAIPGISDAMLSDRLKDLEAARIVHRDVAPETPVRITYSLTPRGQELAAVLAELQIWAERWARTDPKPAPAV